MYSVLCADMRQGLITGIAVTPANVNDHDGFRHICPESGMVFGDKAYGLKSAQIAMLNIIVSAGRTLFTVPPGQWYNFILNGY